MPAFDDIPLKKLQAQIDFCKTHSATEDEWSDRVVYPLLSYAASKSGIDLVTAKSIPVISDLLPTMYDSGASVRAGNKVDYCFGIDLGDKVTLLRALPASEQTFNQSRHPRLATNVLFSHLEIKLRLSSRDGGIQLGVWTAAGFRRLEKLGAKPPPIPLWLWTED